MVSRRLFAFLALFALLAAGARGSGRIWINVTRNAPPTALADQQVTVFQNKLWAISTVSQLYSQYRIMSSSDGVQWTQEDETSSTFKIHNDSRLITFGGKLWIFGPSSYLSSDGKVWSPVNNGPSIGYGSLALHANRLWIQNPDTGLWSSANGSDWTLVSGAEPCLNHTEATLASFGGKLWLLGGVIVGPATQTNDVWSSIDGVKWVKSPAPPWSQRRNVTAVAFDGKLWVMAGVTDTTIMINHHSEARSYYLNEVWFTADGVNWNQVNTSAPWTGRSGLSAFTFKNALWVMGGYGYISQPVGDQYPGADFLKDIWKVDSLPAGAPVIAPIGDQLAREGVAFTGPNPVLTQGSDPVTWSLVAGPAAMRIDALTGVVSWPVPVYVSSPYSVTLRAANGQGADQATFKLVVAPYAPRLSVKPWSQGTQCTLSWTATPQVTGFVIQRDDAPDFKTPVETVTKTSSATLTHTFQLPVSSDGKPNWYRVRGIRRDGLTDAWSNATSSTQDAQSPAGTLSINGGQAITNASLVTLGLSPRDPGANPSGVGLMRFSQDKVKWTDWEPCAPTRKFRLDLARTTQAVYVQYQDRAGNCSAAIGASITLALKPLCVDAAYAGTAPSDGTAAHPYKAIQYAINAASDSDTIYVATGVYDGLVVLKSGIALLGGFPTGRFDYASRNPQANSTVITGPNSGSHDVVQELVHLIGVDHVWLDGLTIGPHASHAGHGIHAGIYVKNADDTCRISNCTVSGLTTGVREPIKTVGIYLEHSSASIERCEIRDFSANNGHGILCTSASAPLIDSCRIQNLQFTGYYVYAGPFSGMIGGQGAGIAMSVSAPTIQNCIITGVKGNAGSAGVSDVSTIDLNSIPTIVNCTIVGNGWADQYCYEGTIRNCIFGRGEAQPDCITPTYSCVPGWSGGGQGNITADSRFVNAAAGDFHLQADSPCIDAGAAVPGLATDFDGAPRGIKIVSPPRGDGSGFDIGAYEYQPPPTVAAPVISLAPGADASSLKVTLQCATAGAAIRCTWAGNEPTALSLLYAGPLLLRGTPGSKLTVKARAFKTGSNPSPVVTQTWTFPALSITQLSRAGVVVDTLTAGKPVYGDRAITFAAPVPSLYYGQLYLRTLNADKAGGVGLSFTVNKPVTVYVAMSEAFGTTRPSWLAGWIAASNPLVTTDAIPGRKLYRKAFPAGRITLGANREGTMPNGPSMYSVLVLPQ